MRNSIRRGLVLTALAGTAFVAAAPAAFAQATTSPEAFALEGTGLLGVSPTPDATTTTPGPANVASVTVPGVLTAKTLSASVTSNSATASVASLGTTGITVPLLGAIAATVITSSCAVSSAGVFTESATVAGGSIAGTALPTGAIPANDAFLTITGVATIVLNQQVAGPVAGSKTVNAIAIDLLGSGEDVYVASSTCGPFTAATPMASGKGLAIGVGLLGAVGVGFGAVYTRRRRNSMA